MIARKKYDNLSLSLSLCYLSIKQLIIKQHSSALENGEGRGRLCALSKVEFKVNHLSRLECLLVGDYHLSAYTEFQRELSKVALITLICNSYRRAAAAAAPTSAGAASPGPLRRHWYS